MFVRLSQYNPFYIFSAADSNKQTTADVDDDDDVPGSIFWTLVILVINKTSISWIVGKRMKTTNHTWVNKMVMFNIF